MLVDERDLWPDGEYVTTHLIVGQEVPRRQPRGREADPGGPTSRRVDEVNADPADAQATVNAEIEKFTTKKLSPELLVGRLGQPHVHRRPDRVVAPEVGRPTPTGLGLLEDPGDLSKLYDLTLLNEVLQSSGQQPVKGL